MTKWDNWCKYFLSAGAVIDNDFVRMAQDDARVFVTQPSGADPGGGFVGLQPPQSPRKHIACSS